MSNERDRNNDRQPLLRLLQSIELTGPFDPITGRQLHVLADPRLRVLDRTGQVAAADTELDRNEPPVSLTENVGCAGFQVDRGDVAQRDIGIHPTIGRNPNLDLANRVELGAKFRRKPYRNSELTIGFQHSRGNGASQCGLNHGINVGDVQPVARRFQPIDRDIQVRLSQNPKHAQIGNSRNLVELGQNASGQALQGHKVRSDNLDGVGAFDPR